MKKLRKKKEEKEEESDKDPYSKVTREPRKKKESPAARSRVAKGPKKQQGGGAAPTPLQAPTRGISYPHAPRPLAPRPASAVDAPGVCRGSACPWGAFWPKPSCILEGKGMWQGTGMHGVDWGVGIRARGHTCSLGMWQLVAGRCHQLPGHPTGAKR